MKKKIFVVCVDRDNDLGRKTKIGGPVIGREANLNAAQKLILADPTESDANTMFAALAKLEEARKEYKNAEIATITGFGKTGLKSDKEINRQLDFLQKNYIVEGWILVTDGMEDNQAIPLLQSRAKIISTEQVVIKQAQAVESTFYTIKEAFRDPGIARLFLGVPGLLILAYVIAFYFNLGAYSLQAMALILGAYLILKGFGIEERIFNFFKMISTSLSEQRISVVLYVAALLSPLFGIWIAYTQVVSSEFIDIISALRIMYPFFVLGILLVLLGKALDSLNAKKAYLIGKYIVQALSVIAVWAILDAGTLVFLKQAELTWFPANIMAAFILLLVAIKIGKVFDIREKVTKALIGKGVIDAEGNYLGVIVEVNKGKQSITLNDSHDKKMEKHKNQFVMRKGKVIVIG